MDSNSKSPEALLDAAKAGERCALSDLLDVYRNYLRLLARTQIDMQLRLKIDPSDLVQETLLEAYRGFPMFRGKTNNELMAWLRKILVRNLADQLRNKRAQKRDLHREKSLDVALERSSEELAAKLCSAESSPSEHASRQEQAILLANALAELPKDYRDVIILRQIERLPFEDIAERMSRTAGAVRMLFARALDRLRIELGNLP